jgi:hypothetical protein
MDISQAVAVWLSARPQFTEGHCRNDLVTSVPHPGVTDEALLKEKGAVHCMLLFSLSLVMDMEGMGVHCPTPMAVCRSFGSVCSRCRHSHAFVGGIERRVVRNDERQLHLLARIGRQRHFVLRWYLRQSLQPSMRKVQGGRCSGAERSNAAKRIRSRYSAWGRGVPPKPPPSAMCRTSATTDSRYMMTPGCSHVATQT